MLSEPIKLVLSLSLSGSILALALFAIKQLIRNRLSKSFQYYIWLIVLIRLVIPFSFEWSLMDVLFKVTPPTVTHFQAGEPQKKLTQTLPSTVSQQVHVEKYTPTQPIQSEQIDTQKIKGTDIVVVLWLAGVVISILWCFISYIRFTATLSKRNKPAQANEAALLKLMSSRKVIALYRNPLAKTPLLLGLFRPRIIIPDSSYSDNQVKNILLHELTHLRRGDVFLKWLTTIITAIHWFNPLVYFVRREMNKACELSCDEAVIKTMNSESKQSYGETLISVVAESRQPFGALSITMCEEKSTLKERLVSIMNYKTKSRKIVVVYVLLLIVLSISACVLGASFRNTEQSQNSSETRTEELYSIYFDELYQFRTPYIGDNSKVGGIITLLPALSSQIKVKSFELQTVQEPYGLTIYYEPIDKEATFDQTDFGYFFDNVCKKDALLLFSLIDNLGEVNFKLEFPHKSSSGETVTLKREYYLPRASFDTLGNLSTLWEGNKNEISSALADIDKELFSKERKDFTVTIPSTLTQYRYREDDDNGFSFYSGEWNAGGLELLTKDNLNSINHTTLLSQNDLSGFAEQANKRLYERDYPAASGRTDTYKELHIALLHNDVWYDFWLDLRYGSEEDFLNLVHSVQFKADDASKQKVIDLVKSVYQADPRFSFEVEYPEVIDGVNYYRVFVLSKNEFTISTMEIFAVNIETGDIKLLNRVSGLYEPYNKVADASNLDEVIHNGVIERYGKRFYVGNAELITEGHVILDTVKNGDELTVYAVVAQSAFGFQNGEFIGSSAYHATPVVINLTEKSGLYGYVFSEIKYPMDGAMWESSIKEMFPSEIESEIWPPDKLENYEEKIREQVNGQVEQYLQSINRKAVYGDELTVPRESLPGNEILNLLQPEIKYNHTGRDYNKYPTYNGTCEWLEDGKRYIYESSMTKTAEGRECILFEKKDENSKIIASTQISVNDGKLEILIGDLPTLFSTQ